MIEEILVYYIIIGISFVMASYITIYRPAMRRIATLLLERLETHYSITLLAQVKKFMSWQYRIATLSIYSVGVFIFFPLVAFASFLNNKDIIVGFSDGVFKGLIDE